MGAYARLELPAVVLTLAPALALAGCLPESGRPPPGEATMVVTAGEALLGGFATADGWNITFDRFLMSIGRVELGESGTCIDYTGESYLRTVDAAGPDAQKVATVFGLHECAFAFQVSPRSSSDGVVLGEGVTSEDAARLDDDFAAVEVVGHASKSERTVSFDWALPQPNLYLNCGPINLDGDEPMTVDVRVHADVLFGENELRFDAFAATDADGDSVVTLAELQVGELVAQLGNQLAFVFCYANLPPDSGAPACSALGAAPK